MYIRRAPYVGLLYKTVYQLNYGRVVNTAFNFGHLGLRGRGYRVYRFLNGFVRYEECAGVSVVFVDCRKYVTLRAKRDFHLFFGHHLDVLGGRHVVRVACCNYYFAGALHFHRHYGVLFDELFGYEF